MRNRHCSCGVVAGVAVIWACVPVIGAVITGRVGAAVIVAAVAAINCIMSPALSLPAFMVTAVAVTVASVAVAKAALAGIVADVAVAVAGVAVVVARGHHCGCGNLGRPWGGYIVAGVAGFAAVVAVIGCLISSCSSRIAPSL